MISEFELLNPGWNLNFPWTITWPIHLHFCQVLSYSCTTFAFRQTRSQIEKFLFCQQQMGGRWGKKKTKQKKSEIRSREWESETKLATQSNCRDVFPTRAEQIAAKTWGAHIKLEPGSALFSLQFKFNAFSWVDYHIIVRYRLAISCALHLHYHYPWPKDVRVGSA